MAANPDSIEKVLRASKGPLSVSEIGDLLNADSETVAQSIWDSPHLFAWQPGGLWTLAITKGPAHTPHSDDVEHPDTRQAVLTPQDGVELRAMTLANGAVLRVMSRPLDTSALLSVRQTGQDLQLILNSSHEAFETLPLPFDVNEDNTDYKRLVETLLAAWAIYEGSIPDGPSRRSLEDARFMWGRSVLYLLDSAK